MVPEGGRPAGVPLAGQGEARGEGGARTATLTPSRSSPTTPTSSPLSCHGRSHCTGSGICLLPRHALPPQKPWNPFYPPQEFPEDPYEQLRLAIYAVFDSWQSERANVYRSVNGITGLSGTAVNVQVGSVY